MYFLGLDPSTKCTGFCVMNQDKEIIERGKISLPDLPDSDKIFYQIQQIEALLTKYSIHHILCEDQFGQQNPFGKINIHTVKKLSQVTGAILSLAGRHKAPISLIYPTSWRKIFHGSGKATKQDTFKKVVADYQIEGLVFTKDNDLTDAVGIAWAAVELHKEDKSS